MRPVALPLDGAGLSGISLGIDAEQVIRILAVDDNADHLSILSHYFSCDRYELIVAQEVTDAAQHLKVRPFDMVLLDLNLRGASGLDLCRHIRAESDLAIIMLTADDDQASQVAGLELGADDYVTKPFDLRELEARIRAVLRRRRWQQGDRPRGGKKTTKYRFGDWLFDDERRCLVDANGQLIDLTGHEYRLLKAFVCAAPRVLTRDQLMNSVSGYDAMPYDRSIDVGVARLRRKLGDSGRNPTLIKSHRCEGYCLAAAVTPV